MIYYFTAALAVTTFILAKLIANLLEQNKALKTHVSILNKDHNQISKENNDFRELIDIQSAMIAESMCVSIEKLN